MKRNYISPKNKVAILEMQSIIAGSLDGFDDQLSDNDAISGGGIDSGATGGGDGGARTNLWDEEW